MGLHMVILFVTTRLVPSCILAIVPMGGSLEHCGFCSCFEVPPGRKRVGQVLCTTRDWKMLNYRLPGQWSHDISCGEAAECDGKGWNYVVLKCRWKRGDLPVRQQKHRMVQCISKAGTPEVDLCIYILQKSTFQKRMFHLHFPRAQ